MIEMRVMGIALDTRTGSPIVVLNDMENRRALPIWIGSAEASAIIRKIEKIKIARPMTHDLIKDLLDATGYTLDKIEIHDVDSETYFASLFISNAEGEEKVLDARPSDAIAVAMRTKSPIFVTAKVLADGTISTDEAKDEAEAEEFKNFIKDIKPSDFKKLMDSNDDLG